MPSWRNSCRTEAAWPFATYLGGGGFDNATGIAVGADGTAYVTGSTQFDPDVSSTASPDFPLANPLQSRFGGVEDAFVTKFSRNGSSLVYSTYLGGELNDDGRAVAVDSAGAVYVTG